ncbi:DUF1971 domain-containing protein [Erwinia sorbitola]|uniref:DUF1971 domain-containing protein n=1 Tax=Erwinia sorbitola TaxID=2681984 RepID=A0A6I6ENX1_9GAMM|nr:DUF1971 domain-containing protein [Erwinia sorbitola]QGU89835.1 DUF1971 domain-containing protein [Erwinia sorbitola]
MSRQIPKNYIHTRSTPFWDKNTVPKALLTHHNTKKGVYARLCVMQGAVKYYGFASADEAEPEIEIIIQAGHFGISPPEYWHHIRLLTDDTFFNIDFFAQPDQPLDGAGIGQVVNTSRAEKQTA